MVPPLTAIARSLHPLRPFLLFMLPLLAALCLFPVSARGDDATLKVRGDMYFSFGFTNDLPIDAERKDDRGRAMQRLRLFITSFLNEAVRAHAFIRIAPTNWGRGMQSNGRDAGFALDTDGVNLSVRQLLLAYQQPDGRFGVSMGLIPLVMPVGAFHDGILRTTGGGISVTYELSDWLTPRFFWARPYDDEPDEVSDPEGKGEYFHNKMDLFGLVLPITHSRTGTEITPWAMYSKIGRNSSFWRLKVPAHGAKKTGTDNDGTAWWAGLTLATGIFDPFVIKANAAYGSIRTGDSRNDFNTRGWHAALSLDYKLKSCTPGVFGWYASGSDEKKVRGDRMWGYTPTISAVDHGFEPTSFGFYSSEGLSSGSAISFSMGGTWGVGARVADVSFLPDLKHTFILAHYGGTNDDELARDYRAHRPNTVDKTILTKGDRAFEANINSMYTVNSNLSFYVQLGLIDLHRGGSWDQWDSNKQTWQALTAVIYKF